MTTAELEQNIKVVCPIDEGIRLLVWADKSSWEIRIRPEATAEQIVAAKAIINDPATVIDA